MDKASRRRFAILAALLVAFAIAGLISLPFLQQCCRDGPPPIGWPSPPSRTLLDRLFFMDMAPRLAALAAVSGVTSLVVLAGIYAATTRLGTDALSFSPSAILRAVAAAFFVGLYYLYGLFLTGYFQLGWLNLIWIIGVPVLLAALTGRTETERTWGGLFLIIPGFVFQLALMMALGIGD